MRREGERPKLAGALPGRPLLWGIVISALTLLVLVPLAAGILKAASVGPARFWRIATRPVAVASYELTLGSALAASAVNAVLGTLLAWVLVRRRFPLRSAADALVDLPFALPTAVAGVTWTAVFSPGEPFGALLRRAGISIAYAPAGILLAMTFVSFPFVVRSVQPVLAELEREVEEAARSLGASRGQTVRFVLLPALLPAILTGMTLSFARAVGEYGSVVLISSNLPFETLVTPVLIHQKLEEYDTAGAAVVASVLLGLSFTLLLALSAVQRRTARCAA